MAFGPKIGGGTNFGGGFMPSPTPFRQPMKPRKLSVSEQTGQREAGGPNMSIIVDPKTGQRLSNEEADLRGPFYQPGFNTNFGQGNRGSSRGGGQGFQGGRGGRIGSAAGALGSKGVPTSQRGRFEKYGSADAAEMTTSEVSGVLNNGFGGLDEFDRMNAGRDQYRTGSGQLEGQGFVASSLPFRDEGGVLPPQQIRTPEMVQVEADRKRQEQELLAKSQFPSLFSMGQFAPRMGFKPQIFPR